MKRIQSQLSNEVKSVDQRETISDIKEIVTLQATKIDQQKNQSSALTSFQQRLASQLDEC